MIRHNKHWFTTICSKYSCARALKRTKLPRTSSRRRERARGLFHFVKWMNPRKTHIFEIDAFIPTKLNSRWLEDFRTYPIVTKWQRRTCQRHCRWRCPQNAILSVTSGHRHHLLPLRWIRTFNRPATVCSSTWRRWRFCGRHSIVTGDSVTTAAAPPPSLRRRRRWRWEGGNGGGGDGVSCMCSGQGERGGGGRCSDNTCRRGDCHQCSVGTVATIHPWDGIAVPRTADRRLVSGERLLRLQHERTVASLGDTRTLQETGAKFLANTQTQSQQQRWESVG